MSNFVSAYTPQVKITRESYQKISQFAMPAGLEARCMESGLFGSKSEYDIAEDECKKWLALCVGFANGGVGLSMTSEKVDEIWHQFILFTLPYHEFCAKFNGGRYLHHIPKVTDEFDTRSTQSVGNFKEAYEACFGKLNAVWPQKAFNSLASCVADSGSACDTSLAD